MLLGICGIFHRSQLNSTSQEDIEHNLLRSEHIRQSHVTEGHRRSTFRHSLVSAVIYVWFQYVEHITM